MIDEKRISNLRSLKTALDTVAILVMRFAIIALLALFGTYKWFAFEINGLQHLLAGTWMGALYPILGAPGVSYLLGTVEYITIIALVIGLFKPQVGALGGAMVAVMGCITLSLLPQLGHVDGFIVKDVLLVGGGLVILHADLSRYLKQIDK